MPSSLLVTLHSLLVKTRYTYSTRCGFFLYCGGWPLLRGGGSLSAANYEGRLTYADLLNSVSRWTLLLKPMLCNPVKETLSLV